jgi:hypothetical protein
MPSADGIEEERICQGIPNGRKSNGKKAWLMPSEDNFSPS